MAREVLVPIHFPKTLAFFYKGGPKRGLKRVREDLVLLEDYTDAVSAPVFLQLQGEIYVTSGEIATYVYVQRFLEHGCVAILDHRSDTPKVCVDVPGDWSLHASIYSVVSVHEYIRLKQVKL